MRVVLLFCAARAAFHSLRQSVRIDPASDDGADKLEKLQPVMEKLSRLDSKTFKLLSSLLKQAKTGKTALLQNDKPSAEEMEQRVEALGPILDRLERLDPKSFHNISTVVRDAETENEKKISFVQEAPLTGSLISGNQTIKGNQNEDTSDRLMKLQPILDRLQLLDPKSFSSINQLIDQAQNTSAK